MAMEELHEKRVDFVQKVQQVVSEDLFKNGLEIETVSLTGLDQTGFKYFNAKRIRCGRFNQTYRNHRRPSSET